MVAVVAVPLATWRNRAEVTALAAGDVACVSWIVMGANGARPRPAKDKRDDDSAAALDPRPVVVQAEQRHHPLDVGVVADEVADPSRLGMDVMRLGADGGTTTL